MSLAAAAPQEVSSEAKLQLHSIEPGHILPCPHSHLDNIWFLLVVWVVETANACQLTLKKDLA